MTEGIGYVPSQYDYETDSIKDNVKSSSGDGGAEFIDISDTWKEQQKCIDAIKREAAMLDRIFLDCVYPNTPSQHEIFSRSSAIRFQITRLTFLGEKLRQK